MFTGIVEAMGVVAGLEAVPGGRRLAIAAPFAGMVTVGDSVAINGCCLTVVVADEATFRVEAVPETLRRTTLGELSRGDSVNLERALRADARLGGHFVQGHVDGVGTVKHVAAEGQGRRIGFALPRAMARFVAEKGSIAVDGVSLTVAACEGDHFEIAFIPHTLEVTVARSYRPGHRVNLEVDLIARYLARLLEAGVPEGSGS